MTRGKIYKKSIVWLVLVAFLLNTLIGAQPVQADVPFLPAPGQLVPLTASFSSPMICGLKFFKDNPFKFNFVMTQGDQASGENSFNRKVFLKEEASRLVKYFLASLAIPEKDMWVNLSPYDSNRIIPQEFGITEMGKDMLAQDYLLKQVASSVMYPEGSVGKEFWSKIYREAYKRFGTTNIPVAAFNKVWIIPGQATVYEDAIDNTAVITESKLKVMLEEDYLALSKSTIKDHIEKSSDANRQLSNELIREIILPLIEKEVNEGKNFATLRQVYNSLILAFWFKNKLKEGLLAKGYFGQKKVNGVDVNDKNIDQEIYKQYLKSYKKGVYNYIKEELTPTNEVVPRKYFSGGVIFGDYIEKSFAMISGKEAAKAASAVLQNGVVTFEAGVEAIVGDKTRLESSTIGGLRESGLVQDGDTVIRIKLNGVQKYNEKVRKSLIERIIVLKKVFGLYVRPFKRILPAITVGVFLLAAANSASAKGSEDLMQHGSKKAEIKQVVASSIDIQIQKLSEKIGADQNAVDNMSAKGGTLMMNFDKVQKLKAQIKIEKEQLKEIQGAKPKGSVAPQEILPVKNVQPVSVDTHMGSVSIATPSSVDVPGSVVPTVVVPVDHDSNLNVQPQRTAPTTTVATITPTSTGDTPGLIKAPGNQIQPKVLSGDALDHNNLLPDQGAAPTIDTQHGAAAGPGAPPPDQLDQGLNLNTQVSGAPPAAVQVATVTSGISTGSTNMYSSQLDEEAAVKQANLLEEQVLLSQLQKSSADQDALKLKIAEDMQLIQNYHLALPNYKPVPLPYQKAGMTPPIASFTPDNVSIALLDYKINQTLRTIKKPIKNNPFAHGALSMNNNAPFASVPVVSVGVGTSFSIVPDVPFAGLINLTQIVGGLPQLGQQGVMSQVLGPAVAVDILANLRNYVVMHPTKGQDVRYDARMTPFKGVVESLTVHVTPAVSFDQEGHRVEKNLYRVGIVKTLGAVAGKVDSLLGDKGLFGHSSDHFIFQNLGYQIKVDDYHQAFTYQAAVNQDTNTSYINAYNIEDSTTRYRENTHHGWDLVDSSTPLDSHLDYYSATVHGFILHADSTTGTMTGQGDVFTSSTFITDAFAKQIAQQDGQTIVGRSYLSTNSVLVEPISSLKDLNLEKQLSKGVDKNGHLIWGVLRNHLGHIVKLIIDPRELNDTSSLTDDSGNSVRFIPGKAYKASSTTGEIGSTIRDYTIDEFRIVGEVKGMFKKNTVADKYGHYDLSERPQLPELPSELKSLVSGNGLILESSVSLKAIYQTARNYYGVVYFADGRVPAVLTGLKNVKTIGSLDEKNGVTRLPNGLYTLSRFKKNLDGNALVLLDGKKQVIAVVDASDKLKQERIKNLHGENKRIDDHKVTLTTLKDGGIEAEDHRVLDPESGKPQFTIFTKGNTFTPEQTAFNAANPQQIHLERELADLAIKGQAITIPVEGSNRQRWIILEKAPTSQLKRLEQSSQQVAPVRNIKVETLTGPDGKVFHGVTIDTEMFGADDIQKLNSLGATAVRTYYPISKKLAVLLATQTQVKTIIVGIPLNSKAYNPENLSNFWGDTVGDPDERVSLENSSKYISYLKQLAATLDGNAKIVVDLGNELNLHPDWIGVTNNGSDLGRFFRKVDKHATDIKAVLGDSVTTSFTLGDNPIDFVTALTNAPNVQYWGVNSYRGIDGLENDWMKATKEAGVFRPFYVAETGNNSNAGEAVQAEADVHAWKTAEGKMGVSVLLMTLQDNPKKMANNKQENFGLYDQYGKPKAGVRKITEAWGEAATSTTAPILFDDTLTGVNEHYALVRLRSNHPAGTTAEEVVKQLKTERVRVSDLDRLAPALGKLGVEILKIDSQGNTVGRYVKMFGDGYQLWENVSIEANMNKYFQINRNDGKGSEYVSLDDLKSPSTQEAIRQVADEVTMMDMNQHVMARVFLNKNFNGSRIEVLQDNHTSSIFELASFSPTDLSGPVAKTVSINPKDSKDGFLHVITTDLRQVNQGVQVEDVYKPVTGGKPVLLYSDRFLQNNRIYFKDGHEYYSVLIDASHKDGQTVTIDGQTTENVTGIFDFNKDSNSGYHVNLRNLDKNGGFAPIRFTKFKDGQINVDQTGFVKIRQGMDRKAILDNVVRSSVLNMTDVYRYRPDGQIDTREVSFLNNGQWQLNWTLKGADIAVQPVLVSQLSSNQVIAEAFAKYKIDKDTILIETIKTDTDGVVSKDYRILGDILEKKIISVIEQGGGVIKTIVGLNFDNTTGEQILSYTLSSDGQVQSLSRTVPNELSYQQLLPQGVETTYAQFMEKHLNVQGANYWNELEQRGVSRSFVPVVVEEIPFLVQTDKPGANSFKSIEPKIRPLVEAYTKASAQDRPALLKQISDTVRQYHQESNTAHYTQEQGQPTYHYLSPPNDSRGRDYITKTSDGDISLNIWPLEGKGNFPANILPASIVVNQSTGELQRTMVFDHHEKLQFQNFQNEPYELGVNVYKVSDDLSLKEATFTSLGDPISKTTLYQRNRVANGIFGVQTRGEETIAFDPLFPYSLPLAGTLDEDGRLTKATLHLEFSVENGHQKIVETSLVNEPTAPGDFRVKTQTIVDGKPISGTLHEEGTLLGYRKSMEANWKVFAVYPALILGLIISGDLLKKIRFNRIKKALAEEATNAALEETSEPPKEREIVYPSWQEYGFSKGALAVAARRYEGTIVPMLKKESIEDVLKEYFRGYQIWRKQVMGIEEPFIPTIEDLWVMFLRDADNDILNADVPDGLNYLMHKAVEARKINPVAADIGGFIRKEYTRWHNIIEIQQTTFQGLSGGKMKNVVPYDYYFTVEDLNEMFRTRKNVEWYDDLGYSLDRKADRRSSIYNDFIASLREKVKAAKAGIEAMADSVGGNVFRMKRKVADVAEYQEYVQFFTRVQKGEYTVSDNFTSTEISAEQANLLINNKPFIRKTFAESGSWVGKMPLPLRMIKPLAQFIRNSYNQLTYPIILTSTVGAYVAAYDGIIGWGTATLAAAISLVVIKGIYYPLSYLLDRKVNVKSFGKPTDFGAGYKKEKLTSAQKWYRTGFWASVISAKVAWDIFLIHHFLIPHQETIGASYYPVIFGHEIPVNMNLLLMGMQWSTSALFLYVSNFAANYLVKPFFTYIHGSLRGLGTIKESKQILALQKEGILDRLIEQKLLVKGGAGLTDEQRLAARRAIIKLAFDQHRYVRDEVSDEEYKIAIEEGRLDHIKIEDVQKSVTQSVNALLMEMPRMPHPEDNTPITVLSPVFGEDIIYAYNNSVLPTTLDMMLNTGYTNLNFIISKAPQRWKNLIERVRRDKIGTEEEWLRMEALLDQNGLLGEISEDLKMQIRLWASYEGQPFARTLDGLMNIVRWHKLYLKLSFPTWSEEQIRERTNYDVQILWAYQIWGDVLNATDAKPELQLKKKDTLYLLKKYYDELGYLVEIASLQIRNGVSVKVLSRYNPTTEQIEDIADIPNTENKAITLEGKPSNQMHAQTFARNKFRFTIDMNQDLDPLEAMKIPIIIQEFKNKNVALVNTPEMIFTGSFTKTGMFHAISDRTFVTSDKRHMGINTSASHHGHPDVGTDVYDMEDGGLSSTVAVSEDYKRGIRYMLRGRTILNREYMQWKKARELSWTGTDGIWRKFSMGAAQLLLGRYAHWMNKSFGPVAGAGEFYSGPHFYTLNTIAALGFFVYTLNVMIGGISPFTAFPAPAVTTITSVFWIGQALTVIGFTQMALESGFKKAFTTFAKIMPFMAPFYIAHIFTYQAGLLSGLAGLAAYVVTGRGFNRENFEVDKLLKVYSKSHVAIGVIGLTLSGLAYSIWRNETFLLSSVTVLSFLFPAVIPFIMNPGNYPIYGVTVRRSAELFKKNSSSSVKSLKKTIWDEGLAQGNIRKALVDGIPEAVSFGVWFGITAPVALPGLVINKIKGAPEYPGQVQAVVETKEEDKAMLTAQPKEEATSGGIDLSKTTVNVVSLRGSIQIAFDDSDMLHLLLNADGLAPIIYDIKMMTPAMADHFVGLDY